MAQFSIQIREEDKLEIVWHNNEFTGGFPVIRLGETTIYPPGYKEESINWLKEFVRQANSVIEQFEKENEQDTVSKCNSPILEQ